MATITQFEGIGYVGGIRFPTVALAVTTSQAYSSGDVMGTLVEFASAFGSTKVMSGILQSVIVTDKGSTGGGAFTLYIFDTKTTGSTFTNDAALNIVDGDLTKLVARVAITSGDYVTFTDNLAAFRDNLAIPVRATTGTSLWAVARFLSTGCVYGTTGDVNVRLGILAD